MSKEKNYNKKTLERSLNYYHMSFAHEDNPGLSSYFGLVRKGQPQIYDTPFAKGESTDELLQAWDQTLVSIRDEWPSLYEFENDLRQKVGPLSIMRPLASRMDDIRSYYEGILLPSRPVSDRAVASTILEFSAGGRIPIRDQKSTVDKMKKSTNSGSPFFTKRRNVTDVTLPSIVWSDMDSALFTGAPVVIQRIHDVPWNAAAVLGWRGQEGGIDSDDVKQRVVWMFPYAVNICELQVYQPFIEQCQHANVVPAWVSMDEVDKRITWLFDTKPKDQLIICTDFTKFDQHFNASLQNVAERVLRSVMDPRNKDYKHWFEHVFPIKYLIPLAIDEGKVLFGKHGMGSGSGGTNCDETIAHRALQHEAALQNHQMLHPASQCLGDDGIISFRNCTVDQVVKAYTSHGLEMNNDKQYASTQDCVYLRRWHHKDYRPNGKCAGVYSTFRALGRLRYLERYMNPKYWDMRAVALRQLSILENVKWHPLKEEFIDFCMKRDKYRLGVDIPHFLDNIEQVAREKIEHMPDFLGYTKTLQSAGDELGGIKSWWIVQYLKSK